MVTETETQTEMYSIFSHTRKPRHAFDIAVARLNFVRPKYETFVVHSCVSVTTLYCNYATSHEFMNTENYTPYLNLSEISLSLSEAKSSHSKVRFEFFCSI